jgi:23S rRNA (pseudouridine1915-N3)-methyltransferase
LKVWVLAVGKPGSLLADVILEYQARAQRYWSLAVVEVKEERARKSVPTASVIAAESDRLLERVPSGVTLIALTRTGDATSSERLARDLQGLALSGAPGMAFLIGGAHGLSDRALRNADRRLRLSTMTLPHDFARLILMEQLYRAGTITRGEPYHKIRE